MFLRATFLFHEKQLYSIGINIKINKMNNKMNIKMNNKMNIKMNKIDI